MSLPVIHDRVKRSKLVSNYDLESVSMKVCAKIGEYDMEDWERRSENDGSSSRNSGDDFFELNLDGSDSSISETPSNASPATRPDFTSPPDAAEFENLFLKKLVKRNLVNKWQASKLKDGRSTFFLGNVPSRYRVIGLLGKGGYGEVYHGREGQYTSNKTGKIKNDVAIKVLQNKGATPDPYERYMFVREYEIARGFKCPNIVAFRGFSNSASTDYCVLEYIDGGDASRLLRKFGRLDYRIACYIVSEAAKGLSYLHNRGFIHRDVKPGNILLMKSGEVKLTDFGFVSVIRNFKNTGAPSSLGLELGKWEERNRPKETDPETGLFKDRICKVQGTRKYIAPEQRANPGSPDPAWDVYSLGCTLYALLTGSPPPTPETFADNMRKAHSLDGDLYNAGYEAETLFIPELSDIPRGITQLILKMMARTPSERIHSVQEVADALQQWISPNQQELFDKIKLGLTGDRENVWSDENIRMCFGIPETVPLIRTPVTYSPGFQKKIGIGDRSEFSISSIFYESVLRPDEEGAEHPEAETSDSGGTEKNPVTPPPPTSSLTAPSPVDVAAPPIIETGRNVSEEEDPDELYQEAYERARLQRLEETLRLLRRFVFYPMISLALILGVVIILKK